MRLLVAEGLRMGGWFMAFFAALFLAAAWGLRTWANAVEGRDE